LKIKDVSKKWGYIPAIHACKRLRQENFKFQASLGYIAGPNLKNPTR
jgi:hypothetical protein